MASSDLSRIARLIWEMDNHSAVTGLNEISDESKKTRNSLSEDADVESASFDRVRKSSDGLKGALVNLAGFIGIGAVGFGLRDLKNSGVALQAQQAQLQTTLRNTGQEAGDAGAKLEKYAESLSTKGGFGTTENLSALTRFVGETHSATEAQNLLTLATNLARHTGAGLADSENAIASAYDGRTRALATLLGPMEKSTAASIGLTVQHQREINSIADEADMMGKLGSRYARNAELADHLTSRQVALANVENQLASGHIALSQATTILAGSTASFDRQTAGHISDLSNSFHNLVEAMGVALLPTINKVVSAFAAVGEWMARNKSLVLGVVEALTALAVVYGTIKAVTAAVTAVQAVARGVWLASAAVMDAYDVALIGYLATGEDVTATTKAWIAVQAVLDAVMDANPIGAVIIAVAALAAGIYELVQHFKVVREVASDVWDWLKDHWRLLIVVLAGPLAPLVLMIEHFKTIIRLAEDVGRAIGRAFSGAEHFITHPFGLNLAKGGELPKYFAGGGPFGTDTIPFWGTPGEGIVNTTGMGLLGQGGLSQVNAGQLPGASGGGSFTVRNSQPIVFNMDGRQFLRAMVLQVLNEAARGTSSLVGGSLVTGAPGIGA